MRTCGMAGISMVGLLVMLGGCGLDDTRSTRDVGMRNSSDVDLTSAFVQYGTVAVGVGTLGNHATKSETHLAAPVPESATVCFRTPDGLDRTRVVDVKPLVPPGFDGVIWFIITPELAVHVELEPRY